MPVIYDAKRPEQCEVLSGRFEGAAAGEELNARSLARSAASGFASGMQTRLLAGLFVAQAIAIIAIWRSLGATSSDIYTYGAAAVLGAATLTLAERNLWQWFRSRHGSDPLRASAMKKQWYAVAGFAVLTIVVSAWAVHSLNSDEDFQRRQQARDEEYRQQMQVSPEAAQAMRDFAARRRG